MIYPIVPVPKPRMTQRDKWQKRACVLRYRKFKDEVRLRRVKLTPPCRVIFHLPFPKSWAEDIRAQLDGTPHRCRPDIDNLIKSLLDALFTEDSHVWEIQAEKRWSRKPCIEVLPLADTDERQPGNDLAKLTNPRQRHTIR